MRDSLYDLCMNELRTRKCVRVEEHPPYYLASFGCHLIHLHNMDNDILPYGGLDRPNLRLHLLLASPPGYSKSFWLEQMMANDTTSLLSCAGVDTTMQGDMTAAGFTGSVRFEDGKKTPSEGIAQKFAKAIIGMEEFSALTAMMKATHSRTLDPSLLQALESGNLQRALAAGPVKYRTHFTLWAGTQPSRFDLSSGLGRRLFFILFIPTHEEEQQMRWAVLNNWNIRSSLGDITRIRERVRVVQDKVSQIKHIEWSPKLIDYLYKKEKVKHHELLLFQRLLLGLHIMQEEFSIPNTVVPITDQGIKMCNMGVQWRTALHFGPEHAEVEAIMAKAIDNNYEMERTQLIRGLLAFGKDLVKANEIVSTMVSKRVLEETTKSGGVRWIKLVYDSKK